MDLGAYIQIEDLDKIAKENGIEIPRLRGYRLMEHEEPVSVDTIRKMKNDAAIDAVENLCVADPFWTLRPEWHRWDDRTRYLKDFYLVKEKDEDGISRYVGIRWDRIHGKKRKRLKYAIKLEQRQVQKQFDVWNKYAGQPNVLYIHARMGGGNWANFEDKESITGQPWFLDRVDDWWDGTYCDFYARVK